ncbi:aminoglycoside adenylyltransferase domain-containing protein [Legionella israelensis]|nr:aminoglycoside adenylyltransferase domain-containing protein [Legionella israelensis]
MQQQIQQCFDLIKAILNNDLLGVYLFGSSIAGGLQKYSDIDLLVISNRSTTHDEKAKFVKNLLEISGIYMKGERFPIEMTIIEKSQVSPWHYPPIFDFQYGEWLRSQFNDGIIEPWGSNEMPDLAIMITQVLLASKTLYGANPHEILCKVPYTDYMLATLDALPSLMADIDTDTRNVLLTLARIWRTVETDTISSKPAAASWSIKQLPQEYILVMHRAKAICIGEEKEYWDDIKALIKPCADFISDKINFKLARINLSENTYKSINMLNE